MLQNYRFYLFNIFATYPTSLKNRKKTTHEQSNEIKKMMKKKIGEGNRYGGQQFQKPSNIATTLCKRVLMIVRLLNISPLLCYIGNRNTCIYNTCCICCLSSSCLLLDCHDISKTSRTLITPRNSSMYLC